MVPSIEKITKEELPARTAYRLSRLLKAATTEVPEFEKQRLALFKKYGEEMDGGNLKTNSDTIKPRRSAVVRWEIQRPAWSIRLTSGFECCMNHARLTA